MSSSPSLPTISLTPFFSPISSPETRLETAKALIKACHETGFVYVTNHSITPALLSAAFSWNQKFFALNREEKELAKHPEGSKVFRGWSRVGGEILPPLEGEKGEGVLDFVESYGHGHPLNTEQPNIYLPPDILPGYHEFVGRFYGECWNTSVAILKALSLGLTGDEEYLSDFHSDMENELSFRHYPSVDEKRVRTGEVDRLGAHTDLDSFTLLWQDNNTGLEVKVGGKWTPVTSIDGALIMNIGDALSRWSNDYLLSTLHRVHLPLSDSSYIQQGNTRMTKSRYSIPYFVIPKQDKVLMPLEGYFGEGKEKKYEPVVFSELVREKLDGIFQADVKA